MTGKKNSPASTLARTEPQCNPVQFFREAAPYIQAHKNKTAIVALASELIASSRLKSILSDIAILSALGLKIILVHGTRWHINQQLGIAHADAPKTRITDEATLEVVKKAVGEQRVQIENALGFILNSPPIISDEVSVVSGNFITAKPIGVMGGVDYQFSGKVRKLHGERIKQQLAANNIVLLSPLGLSPTGVSYNLRYEDVAISTATALQADKLIFISPEFQNLPKELTLQQASKKQADSSLFTDIEQAIMQGVSRVHLLNGEIEGSLLLELFTRDGVGTLISDDRFETVQSAVLNDISAIVNLIRPLEEKGILIKRSREQLELEINNFVVLKRDNNVIACAALYPIANSEAAELACFVVAPDYRGQDKGEQLLGFIEDLAKEKGYVNLFVLTTQTTDWFQEKGFAKSSVEELPPEKQGLYNYQRNSKVLFKKLS
jgi:amino-acid N-acetyltransferase